MTMMMTTIPINRTATAAAITASIDTATHNHRYTITSVGKCKYKTGHYAGMENATMRTLVRVLRGGESKYGKHKYTRVNTVCGDYNGTVTD